MIRGCRRKNVVSNERGATIALVAVSMVALLGFAALAVDVGNLLNIRTESQRVADAAALDVGQNRCQRPAVAVNVRQHCKR